MYHFLVQTLIALGGTQRSRVRVHASAGNFSASLQNWTTLKAPFQFFWHCETFFENFLCLQRVPLQLFENFPTNWSFKKPKGPPFTIFLPCDIFQNDSFLVLKFGCVSGPARYIRILFF